MSNGVDNSGPPLPVPVKGDPNDKPKVPREPIEFNREGYEVGVAYNLTREQDGYRFTYHRVRGTAFEDGGGYPWIRFDVSDPNILVTWEPVK